MSHQPVVLIIRDGWGRNPQGAEAASKTGDATVLADTPFTDQLLATSPHSLLGASGEDVGLPDGQMGNSEVGHLNLGAGRVVYQDLCRISNAINDGSFAANPVITEAFAKAKERRLHLLGLVSDGGVHSHIDHLVGIIKLAARNGVKDIMIHAITDGRDTDPKSGETFLTRLQSAAESTGARIATVVGRFYAMDRDKRWERVKKGWDAIVLGRGEQCTCTPAQYAQKSYEAGTTDEFLEPAIFCEGNQPRVRDDDVVFFINFRADRARELSRAFIYDDFDGFDREVHPKVHYITMTEYEACYPSPIVFEQEKLANIFGEVVSRAGLRQLRIAETEKYAHVTFFFNGGVETQFEGEDRILVPSPRDVATYDEKPQMSVAEVADKFVEAIGHYDVAIMNFANPDMVGHTGYLKAGIAACEAVDKALEKCVKRILELGGRCLICADHGNCEQMINPDGTPNTAHTTNLVDLIYCGPDQNDVKLENGKLADLSPTLLALLGIEQPAEMTGHSLIKR